MPILDFFIYSSSIYSLMGFNTSSYCLCSSRSRYHFKCYPGQCLLVAAIQIQQLLDSIRCPYLYCCSYEITFSSACHYLACVSTFCIGFICLLYIGDMDLPWRLGDCFMHSNSPSDYVRHGSHHTGKSVLHLHDHSSWWDQDDDCDLQGFYLQIHDLHLTHKREQPLRSNPDCCSADTYNAS